MSHGHAPGASSARGAARRALRELVMAATVRIHRASVGYAHDEPATFLGTGFFVAPSWVLTCAHVACGGEGDEVAVVYGSASGHATRVVPGRVVETLPDGAAPVSGNWPTPDLALVQLSEPVDHECVYVSERPAAYDSEGEVLYAGWTPVDGVLKIVYGPLSVEGTIGGLSTDVEMRLGDNDLPYGVSGGPVIDPLRGEVIGVLKSRAQHRPRAGTSIGVEQLRTMRVPDGAVDAEHTDLYQAVFHAHDRYHRDRQRTPDTRRNTWVDVQSQLGAWPGRALTADERIQLLGRLANLPPPVSTRALLETLEDLQDFQGMPPQPAPRGWRDGLGALYESVRDDGALRLVLQYAMGVLFAERPFVVPTTAEAENALWDWVWLAAQRLDARHRHKFAGQWDDFVRIRRSQGQTKPATQYDGPAFTAYEPTASVPAKAQPSVLVELVQLGWEPGRCDWSVSVTTAESEVIRLQQAERAHLDDLPVLMAAPLAEAFRRCDEPGRPAVLQVALPHTLLGCAVDGWQLRPDEAPLGAQRPVVLRCSDRDQLPDDEFGGLDGDPYDVDEERRARWRWLHAHRATAEILDCADGLRKPVPTVEQLRGLSHGTIPVLCRYGDHRYEDDAAALARIVRGGYGVALWRRRRGPSHALCGEFHRGTLDEIAGPQNVYRLPEAVHHLRMRLRSGRSETYWADGIALLYDDPHQPLPGGDLLEAP
ncbi:trypsin-like peptidase domain-containing protein [Streptomyces sp. NPDC005925]|uniref:VMAP-C domain-containing protein n=1 Tax=Streptomyces sp. NPDC005925 TaxID=3157172 RepID=UPI0034106E31